ncbi:glycosyltransferase [Hymenobacter humi]|uniref:Glycosyltransferase n=1 Tax=Hymenobacter humi TaxID=1411620 RepID=A0ABW2UCH0_9BACT
MSYFDVCTNPQAVNEVTIGNYPLKIDEYLAMGKPVVATATRAMDMFADYVYLPRNAQEWLEQARCRLGGAHPGAQRIRYRLHPGPHLGSQRGPHLPGRGRSGAPNHPFLLSYSAILFAVDDYLSMIVFLFWLALAVVLYTYVGYALVVWLWAKVVRGGTPKPAPRAFEPEVTLVVPAYNEADILDDKVRNCLAQDYPADKLRLLFITDGSNDHSGEVLAAYPQVEHLHRPERAGKSMAENRAIRYVTTPYVVFTDCNTLLNPEAVRRLVRHYQDPQVGAVSGEKRVLSDGSASGSGEGLYWKYESFLKQCDSDICSLMGAAGEPGVLPHRLVQAPGARHHSRRLCAVHAHRGCRLPRGVRAPGLRHGAAVVFPEGRNEAQSTHLRGRLAVHVPAAVAAQPVAPAGGHVPVRFAPGAALEPDPRAAPAAVAAQRGPGAHARRHLPLAAGGAGAVLRRRRLGLVAGQPGQGRRPAAGAAVLHHDERGGVSGSRALLAQFAARCLG